MPSKTTDRRPDDALPAPLIVWTCDDSLEDSRARTDRADDEPGDPLGELGLHPLPRKCHRVRVDHPGAPVGFI